MFNIQKELAFFEELLEKEVKSRKRILRETELRLQAIRKGIAEMAAAATAQKSTPPVGKKPGIPKTGKPKSGLSCGARILELLAQRPGLKSGEVVSFMSDSKKDTVQWTLGNLVKKGLAIRDANGAHRKA